MTASGWFSPAIWHGEHLQNLRGKLDERHLDAIVAEAQEMVHNALTGS